MLCPKCQKNEFDPWYSKKQGKDQKYPYKSCYECKQATQGQQGYGTPRNSTPSSPQDDSKRDTFLAILEELQEINRTLKWIQLNMVQGGKGELGKGFDAKKEDIPIVEEQEDEELKNIPF